MTMTGTATTPGVREDERPRDASATAPLAFPQTNLQLFGLMQRAGYPEPDLALVRRAYDLAVRLFTAKYRGSGKPLLAHLVGTAGVLASLRAPAPLVAAGVLHAAYIFGDFGDARGGATAAKRGTLRKEAGAEVEDIIARYDALRWDASSIEEIHAFWLTLKSTRSAVASTISERRQVSAAVSAASASSGVLTMPPLGGALPVAASSALCS